MIFTLFVFTFGIYIGQEYQIPRINNFLTYSLEFAKRHKVEEKKQDSIKDILKKFIE